VESSIPVVEHYNSRGKVRKVFPQLPSLIFTEITVLLVVSRNIDAFHLLLIDLVKTNNILSST